MAMGAILAVTPLTAFAPAGAAAATSTITVTSPGNLRSLDGDPAWLQIAAVDSSPGETLSYSADGLPPGLSIRAGTGVISGFLQLPPGSGAVYTAAVTVSDPAGASASVQFAWAVSQQPTDSYPVGVFHSGYSVKCLADKGGVTANGNPIVLAQCNHNAPDQQVTVVGGTLRVLGKCISDPHPGTAGTKLNLWACNGSKGQDWQHYRNGLTPDSNLMCIDAPASSAGTRLTTAPCGSPAAPAPAALTWHEQATQMPLWGTGACLGAGNSTTGNPAQTRAALWPCNGMAPQSWSLDPMGGPLYTIAMFSQSYCLAVSGAGTADGTAVTVSGCAYGPGQLWELGTDAAIINPHSGKCLADPGGSTVSGSKLVIQACDGSAGQRWGLPAVPVSAPLPGTCLATKTNKTGNGIVMAEPCDGTTGQRWTLEADGTLRALGRCLNISDSRMLPGTPVNLSGCFSQPDQQWALDNSTGSLYSPALGLCLAIPGSAPAAGTQLEISDCSPGTADDWHLQ